MFQVLIVGVQWVELMNNEIIKTPGRLHMNWQVVCNLAWESDINSHNSSGVPQEP